MGALSDAKHIELTDQQKARIDNRIAELKGLLESQHYAPGFDESNPDHRLFFQAFDGTGNDRDNVPDDGRRTNPDILQELVPWTQTVRSEYRSGVGTDGGIDKLNYPGGGGAAERAEEVYDRFREQAQAWQKENPDVDIYVSLAGFSRGSGTARHFANLVYERGVPADDAEATRVLVDFEHNGHDMVPVYETTYDKYVVPPGEAKLDTMLIYETVVTGQSQNLKLEIPPVKDLKVLHLTANDELRDQFDAQSIINPDQGFDPRLYEFGLPGAHGDLGGGYVDNWLSSRYLELGHLFLKENGVPLTDIPRDYQTAPDAAGVIHDPDKLYYTTFGSREINYSENKAIEDTDAYSYNWIHQNVLSRLEYIDKAYTGARGELEWARAHPHDPEAAGILAREAEIERDLEHLTDAKEQIFRFSDFSLETMAAYNRQFAEVQSEADRRMHEKEYADDIATVSIFTDTGELNAAFVQSFNSSDTVTEFLQSNEGLQLADAGDDAILQSEYAAFVYNKALTEAAARTGVDVAKIRDLDVPGNPDAPGYHYQEDGQGDGAVPLEVLAKLLGTSETEVRELAADGELGSALAAQQAAQVQSGGVQQSVYGAADLIRGLDNGDALDIAVGLGRLGLGVDQLQDGFDAGTGWLDDSGSAGLQAGLSAAAFVDDVLQGEELGAISSGSYLVDHLGATFDDPGWQGITDHAAVGTGLSALSLYQAMDGGDAAAITGTGIEVANGLSQGAVAEQLSGISGLPESAPYASYLMAGVQLIEGDVEQAGVTALGGYLMSTGHPVAVGIGAALSVFGGSLMGNETPKAWADFRMEEDGSIAVDVDSNGTGGDLVGTVSTMAEDLAPVVDNLRSYGVEIQPGFLPRIGIRGDEFYLEHGGGTRLITDPQAELPLLLEMNVIGHWMIENDIELWSRSGRHVYLGETDWSHTVRGTGVYAGGGQAQHAPVSIDARQVLSLNDPTLRTVARQLAEVTRTWRVDKGLFAGEGGALLAVGLGAGLVQYPEIAEAVSGALDPVSLFDNEETAALIEGTGAKNIIGAGFGLIGTGADDHASTFEIPSVASTAYAPYDSERRSSVYDDAMERFETLDLLPVSVESAIDSSGETGSLPVFDQSGEAADPEEATQRIRALADGDGGDVPPLNYNDGSGNGGSSDGELDSGVGENVALPVSHGLSLVEDRYLVTRIGSLADDDEAFLALGGTRNGVVALHEGGEIRFTPPPDFHGQAGFEYQVRTTDGGVETRWVAVTVNGRNDRPDARDDQVIAVEDEAILLDRLLANDHDVDGDPMRIAAVSQVSTGAVENDDAGGFRYVPPRDYTGDVQLTYVIEDPAAARTAARATLVFEESDNDPPVVDSVVLEGGIEDEAFTFHQSELFARAHDPEGGMLSIESITAADGGAVNWDRDSGEVVFTPEADFHGLAQVEFDVADPESLTTTGTADVAFENVPDPFLAGDTRLSIEQNQMIVLAPEDLLPRLDIDNPDGSEVAIVAARMAPGMPGWVNHRPDGSVQWIPPQDYSGQSAFEVRLFNGVERIASRIDLDIAEVNDPPWTQPVRFDAVEDQGFAFNAAELLANDTDPEGDAFSLAAMQLLDPEAGTLSFDPVTGDGRLDPAPDFFGEAKLEYTVMEDVSGLSSTGLATVVFAPVDDPPVTTDKTFILAEDETVDYPTEVLLDETIDVDGEAVSITDVRIDDAAHGAVALRADGGVRFTPAPDFFGEAGFELDYTDGVTIGTARVDLTVEPVNDAPVGQFHRFTGALEDQPFEIAESALLAGATDVEGDAIILDAVALAAGQGGQLDRDPVTGRIIYTPEPDFYGEVQMEYTLRDTLGARSTGTAAIVVHNVEDDFSLSDRRFTVSADEAEVFTPVDLLDSLTDADGDVLRLTTVRMNDPSAGEVTLLADGSVRFTPQSAYAGPVSFEYDVTDGTHTHSVVAALQVESTPEEPPRLTGAVEDQVFELHVDDLPVYDDAPGVGDFELTAIQVVDPDTGSVAWNRGSGDLAFTPAPDFFGEALIEYSLVEAGSGQTLVGTAAIDVEGVDDPPQVTDKDLKEPALNLDEDLPSIFSRSILLDTLRDVDGEVLTIVDAHILDDAHGTVSLTAGGDVRFEPAPDYHGEAPFEIDVTDGNTTVSATIAPMLWPINDAPRVRDDHAVMDEDTNLVVNGADILANDYDVDGPYDAIRIVGPWAASAGVANYDAGADELRYTPPADEFGEAWVDYIVEDGEGAFSVARLDVTINNVYDPVQAVDDLVVVQEDTDHLFEASVFTANDRNPDRGTLEIVAIDHSDFSHGHLSVTDEGRIDYRSEADYAGEQTFIYTVQDESGHRTSATVRFVVEEVNDAPRVNRINEHMLEDEVRVFAMDELLGNALDVEEDWMQVVAARSTHGVVDFDAPAGEITFTPIEHLNSDLNDGALLFEYLVRDEKGAETWGAVDLDVEPVNDPPQAGDDLLFAWESGPGGYVNLVMEDALLANDIEVDGEAIRIDQITQGAHGTVTLDTENRMLGYYADPGFIGQDTFTYCVTDDMVAADGTLSAEVGTVTVQVLENQSPVAHDFATIAAEDTVLDFGIEDFMAHVDDEDLELLELPENHRIVAVKDAVNGQALLGPDGGVRFVPTADYNSAQHGGVASFGYVVEDIVGNRSAATASITYTPVNDEPVAVDDVITQTIYEEQVAFINIADLLTNDYDVDDNPGESSVTFDGLVDSRSENGTITIVDDRIRYVGDVDYFGGERFQYRIIDGQGGSDTGTVHLDIANVNDAPMVEFDSARADDSGYNTLGGLLDNDYDADGDVLRIVNPSHGSVVSNGTAIRFDAENRGHDYNMTITYGVTDGQETVQSRVDVQVIHVNRPPTSLTQIQTDADSVFVAGNDPDTPDPAEIWLGGTVSFMGYSWNAEVGTAAGSGAGQNGLFIDLRNQFNHPVDWPNPTPAAISGTGTFSYTIGVSDGDNEVQFSGSIPTQVSIRNINFMGAPVVIDLNDDGLSLQSPEESGAAFDWTGDDMLEATGWITGQGDAILAYDNDSDGHITQADEISFVQYLDDARTDLEGLRAFDSNDDGVFDVRDDEWSRFGLWVDDGDAVSESGELIGMEQSGIESLSLTSDEETFDMNGNRVFGMAEVVYTDGTTGQLGDVAFATIPESPDQLPEEPVDDGEKNAEAINDGAPTAGEEEESINADTDTSWQESAGPGDEDDESGADENDTADAGSEIDPDSDVSADTSVGASSEQDFDLLTDEELDRMTQSDNAQSAAAAPEEEVADVDVNTALNDPGNGKFEAEEPEEAALAA